MSNIVVKMMSGEDKADTNTGKRFTLVESHGEVTCARDANGKPLIQIPLEDGQTALYHPEGNTYILQNGKTVASFAYSNYKDVRVERIRGTAILGKESKSIRFTEELMYSPEITTLAAFIETINTFSDKSGFTLLNLIVEPETSLGFTGDGYSTNTPVLALNDKNIKDLTNCNFAITNDIDVTFYVTHEQLARFDGWLIDIDGDKRLLHFDYNRNKGKGELLILSKI